VVPASADIVTNGQFLGPAGNFTTVFAVNSTTIPGWTVSTGSVDWIGTYWSAPGGQSVDLDGNSPGAISQNIPTVAGQTYWLSFWLAGNPDGGPVVKTLAVTVGADPSHIFTFDTTGKTKTDMGWEHLGFSFTGPGGSTIITFASNDVASPWGPALADVRVPGPDFYTEFAVGLSGLGLLMFIRRKRQA
jgi:choice-of-anchor C domain-containing protein